MLRKVLLCLLSTSLFAADRDASGAIDVIKYMFETKYAPLYYKEQLLGWNLAHSITGLKHSISFTKNPQWLLRKFFLQPCDYHTSIFFQSTAMGDLPFSVKKIGNSLYVSHSRCNVLKQGDEILFWDGFPAVDVFNQFKVLEISGADELYSTDTLTEYYLTHRVGEYGLSVPRGEVCLSVLDKETLEVNQVFIPWDSYNEYYPFKGWMPLSKSPFTLELPPAPSLFNKKAQALTEARSEELSFRLASKRGFLPLLGPVVNDFKKAPFFYYIYTTPGGNKVAFLRLADFSFDRADLAHLKKAFNYFQKNSDGLILDLTHNPGGYVLNLMALVSYLIEFPVKNYEQTEILTSDEVELAVSLKVTYEDLLEEDENELVKLIKKESQYNPDLRLAKQFLNYANFLIEAWESGERITPLYPILGIDEIHPDPSCTYTKPLLILTDHLSLSCADFFPGILQESGRAKVFGETTGGAGGVVAQPLEFPNQLGIRMIVLTSSLIYKSNGEPIENHGITPDYPYSITPDDLKYEFIDYVNRVNEKMDEMIEDFP